MSPAPTTPALTFHSRLAAFAALTALFTLLHYMGASLYHLAGGLTTVKPFSGVALALILILGQRWMWPVLAAGTLGGMLAKVATAAPLYDLIITPCVTALTLLLVHLAARRLIGKQIDFRAWRQLVGYIAVCTVINLVSATIFTLLIDGFGRQYVWVYWQAWFIPTALSYVIFTPVMMLLATAERRVLAGNWKRLAACMLRCCRCCCPTSFPSACRCCSSPPWRF